MDLLTGGSLTGIIVMVIEVLKKFQWFSTRIAPVVAFTLGMVGGCVFYYLGFVAEGTTLVQALLVGIAVGGSATGLYDVAKTTIKGQ